MAELAVVSVRKAKMQKYLEEGNKNAEIVMELLEDPNEFLSTVQIGISLIGVLTGAFGGVTLAEPLASMISFVPYSEPISVAIVVIITSLPMQKKSCCLCFVLHFLPAGEKQSFAPAA